MQKMAKSNSFLIILICAVCITAIEMYAINRGMNGTCLTTAMVAIAALGGASIPNLLGGKGGNTQPSDKSK